MILDLKKIREQQLEDRTNLVKTNPILNFFWLKVVTVLKQKTKS